MQTKQPFRLNEKTGLYKTGRGVTPSEIIEEAEQILRSRLTDRQALKDPGAVKAYLLMALSGKEREEFVGVMLDNQHRVIEPVTLAIGTIDGASVYPREVVRAVLARNAAAVIFAHNHPSGLPEPSAADRALTARLKSALALIDVRVLDHFVVGSTDCVSFAERGWL